MKPKTNRKPGPYDNFQTPGFAADPLWQFLPKIPVWECACGNLYLVHELERRGLDVSLATDLITGFDFLLPSTSIYAKYHFRTLHQIITNPPFSLKKEFVHASIDHGFPFSFLMPSDTAFTGWFAKLTKKHEFMLITPDKRINYKTPELGWQWQITKPYNPDKGETVLDVLDQGLKTVYSASQFDSSWFLWGYDYIKQFNLRPGEFVVRNYFTDHWTREYREQFEYEYFDKDEYNAIPLLD